MFEKIKLDPLNQFYPVNQAEIKIVNQSWAFKYLSSLKNFMQKSDMAS